MFQAFLDMTAPHAISILKKLVIFQQKNGGNNQGKTLNMKNVAT